MRRRARATICWVLLSNINRNTIAKRLFIVFFCLLALVAQAKQITITPRSGSAWNLALEDVGYLRVMGDSLIIVGNAGETCAREALVNVRKIAVEEQMPTGIKRVTFPLTGRKVIEPNGRIVIQKGEERYGVEGMMN